MHRLASSSAMGQTGRVQSGECSVYQLCEIVPGAGVTGSSHSHPSIRSDNNGVRNSIDFVVTRYPVSTVEQECHPLAVLALPAANVFWPVLMHYGIQCHTLGGRMRRELLKFRIARAAGATPAGPEDQDYWPTLMVREADRR
jgi:hypothetical protein